MRTTLLLIAAVLLLPDPARAQIPLPGSIGPIRPIRRTPNPVKRLEKRLEALKAQLTAIRELSSWAETSRRELWKIYSDSLANLVQARAAIARAKGKGIGRFKEPKGFEIETIRVGTGTKYPYASSKHVPVVPPDDFRLFVRVNFPMEWVRENRKLRVKCQIYPDNYLPMASRYQNTTKAVYHVSSYTQKVNRPLTTFNVKVNGYSLPEGQYFASCRVSDTKWPPTFLVTLGMFRVKGKLPKSVRARLPHYPTWYRTYKSVVSLDTVDAKMKGKAIQLSGSFTRSEFKRGQKPVYIIAVAERLGDRTVVLRRKQTLRRANNRFGGRKFLIKDHKLKPGSYKLNVGIYTEHKSGSRYSYIRGSRAEKKLNITVQ